ncbi:hypothetical protein [Streptomyces sp. NBC_01314]|uniref:hypothetical protein n=1 Tax=Streptomyces sp. NBC_01314 TaxID=2903821 RepID=UPI003093B33F|nr:hypothetical protein OG622_50270 [Streptomyces sp. NBC_01314]
MARKLNKKSREALNRVCLVVALVFAAPTYALVPVDGRGPIAAATAIVGALAYGVTRYVAMRAWAAASRPAPRTRTAK